VSSALWFLVVLAIAIAIAAASLLFRFIEVPLERRLRGSSPPRAEVARTHLTHFD
jgi:peptidoglycan/LPS O-acetylase OafA/YrhL